MFKIVTCPETETLELVECVDSPLGHLIHRCTRFRPVCAVRCARRCAIDLDRTAAREEVTRGPVHERDGQLMLDFELELELLS